MRARSDGRAVRGDSMTVTRFYQEQLRSHNYQGDEAQESAVAR